MYSVATDEDGAKLSANLCESLLRHNVSKCAMVGFEDEAIRWWADNERLLPPNAVHYDATAMFRTVFDLSLREKSRGPLVSCCPLRSTPSSLVSSILRL